MTYPIEKTQQAWQDYLADKVAQGRAEPSAYAVARKQATERPFTGKYEQHWASGRYACVRCGQPLFASNTKFDAGCGWPSFSEAVREDAIEERRDVSHGMIRTETVCAQCGAHLGHVFEDGPRSGEHGTGRRYCMNSAALEFVPESAPESADETTTA